MATKFRKHAPVPETARLKNLATGTSEIFKLDPRIISRDPGFNTRYDFGEIQILAEDILANGIQEPLTVRKEGSQVLLVNGDRRLSAVEFLMKNDLWPVDPKNPGFPMPLPCKSEGRDVKPIDRLFMMLSLNSGKPFNMLEKGFAYEKILTEDPDINASEIARRSGETKQAVSNALQLVKHGSPTLIQHIKDGTISPTTAHDIIKSTNGHDEQNEAAEKAIAAATAAGRSHATPKDLPVKPQSKTKKTAPKEDPPVELWNYQPTDDHQWIEGRARSVNKFRALQSIKNGIAILELFAAKDADGFWYAGTNLQTEKIAHNSLPDLTEPGYVDEPGALTAAWKSIGPLLGDHARSASNPEGTLDYLSTLGSQLTARFPTGWDHDNSIFAEAAAESEGFTYIADPNEDDDDGGDDDADETSNDEPGGDDSNRDDSPADPGAYQRLKSAPSSTRDGSIGGPGEGFATPDKRVKNIEKAMDELDRSECDDDRWNTVELVLDYLNGNHTIKTIKDHLKND